MLGDRKSNSIERELDNVINCPHGHKNFESLPNRGSSYQENEIKNIDNRNEPNRQDGLADSIEILSSEMNARLSQEIYSLINAMQTQIKTAISSAINDRVLPEIQNIMGSLPSHQNGTGTGASSNEQGFGKVWRDANTTFTKKDSRSA